MFLYNIGIKLYIFFIYLASPFVPKAAKAIKGRRNFFSNNKPDHQTKYIWFHTSSLGEFEQGRPLIEKIKKENPGKKILLSFYSPSGFEVRMNYDFADRVIYLPFDSLPNARKFFEHFEIEMAIFVKYDVWPFFIKEAFKKNIPVFLTSAVFRNDHFFFKWYGKFFLQLLKRMKKIFVQDENSVKLAQEFGLDNVIQAGDVRVDRVLEIKKNIAQMPEMEKFIDGKKCIVFGSVYDYEIPIIQSVLNDTDGETKFIIVPHDISENILEKFKAKLPENIFYSQIDKYKSERILIVDHVGSLNKIYQYASMAYIGGGFKRRGLHNTLEPAVFNIPVFFGPHFHKYPEAVSMLKEDLVFVENSAPGLAKIMALKLKEQLGLDFVQRSQKWFTKNSGATDLIYKELSAIF
jgi:3-deoxy-D-manno-octulosonic-acid transferase